MKNRKQKSVWGKFILDKHLVLIPAALLLLIVIGGLGKTEKTQKVSAGSQHNLSGYAWSDNIGWISFNCTNNGSCGTGDYGVNINTTTGAFSGYAWSDNIGWISFNPADVTGCPSSPCSPVLNISTGVVTGWAKALEGGGSQSGGWDGWIKLSGTSGDSSPYGVSFLGTDASGYAWGADVVGWMSWSGDGYGVVADTGIVNPGPTVTITSPVVNPVNTDTVSPVGFSGTASSTNPVVAYEWRSGSCSAGTLLNSTTSFQQLMPLGTTTVYFRAQDNTGQWSLSCPNVTIVATAPLPINGACGSTSGSSYGVAPTTGLCSAGTSTSTPVLVGGSWRWGCQGMYGGTDINSCSATNSCGNATCERTNGETPATCRSDCQVNYREF